MKIGEEYKLGGFTNNFYLSADDCLAWDAKVGTQRDNQLKQLAKQLAMGVLVFTVSDICSDALSHVVATYATSTRKTTDEKTVSRAASKITRKLIVEVASALEVCGPCAATGRVCKVYCAECETAKTLCDPCKLLGYDSWFNEGRECFSCRQHNEGSEKKKECTRDCVILTPSDGGNFCAITLLEEDVTKLMPGKPFICGIMDMPHQVRGWRNMLCGWLMRKDGWRIGGILIVALRCGEVKTIIQAIMAIIKETALIGKD